MKKIYQLMAAVALIMGMAACSDDDDNNTPSVSREEEEPEFVMTAEQLADYTAKNFISRVCDVEIDEQTGELKKVLEVNYGRVLESTTPTVRYAKVETREAALEQFRSMVGLEATIKTGVDGTQTVEMGSHGSVVCHPSSESGEWVRIDINMKELSGLTQIVMMNPAAWPENGVDSKIPYGSVYSKNGIFYICIDNAKVSTTGYLIGFDTKTRESISVNHTYKGKNCYHTEIWKSLPGGLNVIKLLRSYLYDDNGSKNSIAESTIKAIGQLQDDGKNSDVGGPDALYNFLYSAGPLTDQTPFFKTGDDTPWMSTAGRKEQKHSIRVPYTKMGKTPDDVKCTQICYECNEVDPATHDTSSTHTRDSWANASVWGGKYAWCMKDFDVRWILKTDEWFSFQSPSIIAFPDIDAVSLEGFLSKYELTKVEL